MSKPDDHDKKICEECGKTEVVLYREKGGEEWECEECYYEEIKV